MVNDRISKLKNVVLYSDWRTPHPRKKENSNGLRKEEGVIAVLKNIFGD